MMTLWWSNSPGALLQLTVTDEELAAFTWREHNPAGPVRQISVLMSCYRRKYCIIWASEHQNLCSTMAGMRDCVSYVCWTLCLLPDWCLIPKHSEGWRHSLTLRSAPWSYSSRLRQTSRSTTSCLWTAAQKEAGKTSQRSSVLELCENFFSTNDREDIIDLLFFLYNTLWTLVF